MKTPSSDNGAYDWLEVRPQFILTIGTQAEIALRYWLERIAAWFGFIPPYIEALALDSTGQASCGAPLLPARNFLNFAHPAAEHVMRHLPEYPELARWFPASCQKLAVGNGAGGERAAGMLFLVTALPLITRVLTERLARFRPECFAGVAAECNRDRRLTARGLTVAGDKLEVWLVTTFVGGTCAATPALAALIAKLGRVEGVRLTQNALVLLPEIAGAEGLSFSERHKWVNSYAGCAEWYSALARAPFAIETLAGILEQEGQLFQSVLLAEPPTGGLERLTRQLGAEVLFHLTTTALGSQYHRKTVDLVGRVFSQEGPFSQKRIFSAVGAATLHAAPENARAIAAEALLCGALERLLSRESFEPVSADAIDDAGLSFAKLQQLRPSLTPLQPRRMTVSAVEKAIIAHAPTIAGELKRVLEAATAEARRGFEAGRQQLYQRALDALARHGLRALAGRCDQVLQFLQEEKRQIQAARSHLTQRTRTEATAPIAPEQRLRGHNERCQASLEEQFLSRAEADYQRLVEWFGLCLTNARSLIGQLERLQRRHQNLLEAETAKVEAARQHVLLDTQAILGLLADPKQALAEKVGRLLETALESGELEDDQVQGLREQAGSLAAEGLKPYQSLRAALALADESQRQRIFRHLFQAAQPSLRLRDDYTDTDYEEHLLAGLSESDTDLLAVLRSFAPHVVCSGRCREDAIVIMRVWHGIEPSAMPTVHEARAAYARQVELLGRAANGAPREVFPFVDRRFQPPCLVVPSGIRRQALLLMPLSGQVQGPIRYDPGRCTYVYHNGHQPIELGNTRKQAFDNLIREENRSPELPPLEALLDWSRQQFEALGPQGTIELLKQMIQTLEGYLRDPDLAADRLILEEEHRALELSWLERCQGLRRELALAKANGNHQGKNDPGQSLAS